MKSLSIRMRITLWFGITLILVVALTFGIILYVSDGVLQETTQDELVEAVEENYNEIEFFDTLDGVYLDNDNDQYLEYEDGYLEIDDDFLKSVNGICTALYQDDGTLLYGENPITKESCELEFSSDESVRKLSVNGLTYYIYDKPMQEYGLDGLWLRGIVSSELGNSQISSIVRLTMIILPSILIIAILGGYLLAKRSLVPIKEISDTMGEIIENNDLKKQIIIKKGNDELIQLAKTFNEMIKSLDTAFEREKRFVSDVSHELRTPVAVILSQCEYSLEEKDPDEYEDSLKVIQRQGRKMDKMISQMLEFSRLEFRSDAFERADVDLSELTASTCDDMRSIGKNNIQLNCDIEQGVVVNGNRALLSRLLVNLISNAYKYGKENGHVEVTLKQDDSGVILKVSDDGIGISPENKEKIFDRFYQADPSRNDSGNGLGLALVKEIALFHNGDVSLESTLGAGSTFTVILKK